MPQVPQVRTKHDRLIVLDALREGWKKVRLGNNSGNLILALLYAQYAFETGHGQFCWNNNFGNHRADQGYVKDPNRHYFELPSADEYIDGKRVIVGGYFRAYPNVSLAPREIKYDDLVLGTAGHIELLSVLGRYRLAWKHLLDVEGVVEMSTGAMQSIFKEFVYLLKLGGYFTGNADDYANGVSSIALSVVDLLSRDTLRSPPMPGFNERNQPQEWGHIDAQQGLERIFGDEWSIEKTASFLGCRYDCPVAV